MDKNLKGALQHNLKIIKLNAQTWHAVENFHIQEVKNFLKREATLHKLKGIQLRRFDLLENTPLHIAAKHGYLKIVEMLINLFVQTDARN